MKNRSYVVLGGTGGIGSALVRRLAAGGASVTVAGRDEDRAGSLAAEIDGRSAVLDATGFDEVVRVFEEAKEATGGLDGVVNCVGSVYLRPAHLTSQNEWRRVVETNLGSAFATVRAAASAMRPDGGAVVLVSSGAVRTGLPNHEAIAAAKGGVEGLVRAAAATYAGLLRVNAVAPGLVRTPATESITSKESAAETSRRMHAAGRLGEPDDVASAIAWLLGPDRDWVTGQVLGIDGGLSTVRARATS